MAASGMDAPSSTTTQLVQNPSFEDGNLDHWQMYGAPALDDTIARHGSLSVRLGDDERANASF
jgi:hypothetical protein